MKVLFLLGDISGHGGTERVSCELANKFVNLGADVEVLSPFGPSEPYFALDDRVHVEGLGLREVGGKLTRYAGISYSIFRALRRACADVVVVVDTIQFLFCVPWLNLLPARFICWEHFNLTTEHGSRFRSIARRAAAWQADALVVLTQRDADRWRARFRVEGRVQAIPNPIPWFSSSASPIDSREQVVLAVGRLTPQKGFDVLLRAWQALGRVRSGWQLRIMGGGNDLAKLEQLAADLAVTHSVVFVGQVKDVAAEYRRASIYVMSSRWEGLPMTLLEAQHFGLPSISTDCETGPREVLECGSGVLVPVDDVEQLAGAMAQLIADGSMRIELGDLARRNAERYRPDAIVGEWQRLFARLTS